MIDRFREPDLDPEWGKDETDEMYDTESLLDRLAHGATDQDDAEAVRGIIEERDALLRTSRRHRCVKCRGTGQQRFPGDTYGDCLACDGRGY